MTASRGLHDECDWAQQHVTAALEGNRTISTAIGLVMAEHRMTRADAFDALRSRSQHTNVNLSKVAAEIVRDFELRCR